MFSTLRRRGTARLSRQISQTLSYSTFKGTTALMASAKVSKKSKTPKTVSVKVVAETPQFTHEGVVIGSESLESLLQTNTEIEELESEDRVSHGEEEIEEANRGEGVYATDLDSLDEATTLTSQKKSKKHSALKTGKEEDDDDLPEAVYRPVNLSGSYYEGELESLLRSLAVGSGFQHEIWSSKEGYKNRGISVTADDEEGCSVKINNRPVTLFNVMQTSISEMAKTKSTPDVLRYLRTAKAKTIVGDRRKAHPRWLSSKPLFGTFRDLVMNSEIYPQFKDSCNIWVTLDEVMLLTADIQKEEIPNGIMGPEKASPRPDLDEGMLKKMEEYSVALGVKAPCTTVIYNLMQLDDTERFEPFYNGAEHICINLNGRRYGNVLSFLMCEYCHKYNFNEKPFALFVTNDTVKKFCGVVLEEVNGERPPPFTTVIKGDIVSFHHADQTNISELLYDKMWASKRDAKDLLRAKYDKPSANDDEVTD